MRELDLRIVTSSVTSIMADSNFNLEENILERMRTLREKEESPLGRSILKQIEENDLLARRNFVPMCQDTGMVVVFLEIGSEVVFTGDIYEAVNLGVRNAYIDHFLRRSVVRHPLRRDNTKDNTPAVIHTKIVAGDKVKITVAPKGGGAENTSIVKMLIPADGYEGVKKFVIDTVNAAGGKACPPIIVGLGIGGNLEKSAIIAKEALMRDIDDEAVDELDRKLEQELMTEINKLGIGPMGLGGSTTCLAVKVNSYPCHIASLPVAVNIQCHAARHKSIVI
jgi:fumarate hydratase subunit alpha